MAIKRPDVILEHRLITRIMNLKIRNIKLGLIILRLYAPSTLKRRRAAGLSGALQNLYGSMRYSGKSWRTLDSWRVQGTKAIWTRSEAATIYGYNVRRLGFSPIHRA